MPKSKFKVNDALGDALMSAFLSTRGLRPELVGAKGFKPGIQQGFLELKGMGAARRIVLTEAGKQELSERTRGLPLPMIELLLSKIPDLSPVAWFDLRETADLDRALKWIEEHWLHVQGLSGTGMKIPLMSGYWHDTSTGNERPVVFRLPDDTSLLSLLAANGVSNTIVNLFDKQLRTTRLFSELLLSPPQTREAADALHAEESTEHRRCWRTRWGSLLDNAFQYDGPETFLEALESDEIDVYEGVCESEPNEHCVRAQGRFRSGSYCHDLNLMLLMPAWDRENGPGSLALAKAVVASWSELRRLHTPAPFLASPASSLSMSLC